ncbi:MAG: YicC/YloC family endoribonuclease [Spirosomataceae bacterium]
MLKSMTGFGSATVELPTLSANFEIKTLNSKFLDIYCRIPKNYSEREVEIRNMITRSLERGKVECTLTIQPKTTENGVSILNRPLVKAYFKELQNTAEELGFTADQTELLRMAVLMPNAYNADQLLETDQKENEWMLIREGLEQALAKVEEFRIQEGAQTALKFKEYIARIDSYLEQIKELDKSRIPAVRERLHKNVRDLVHSDNFDHNRFEQEIIYYVERYDISEEKVRLKNHLEYFLQTLDGNVSQGKKLNFIAQEIGREINTIGSKANDSAIQRLVVQMKDELEKIKEQTMNTI